MVKISVVPDEKIVHAIADLTYKYDSRMKRSRYNYLFLGIASLVCLALCKYFDAIVCMGFFVLSATFALYMFTVGLKSRFEKAMMHFDTTKVERIYTVDEDGINVESELGRGEYIWEMFLCWGYIRNYIYVLVNSRQVILIDKEKLSEEDLAEVQMLLAGNVRFTTE